MENSLYPNLQALEKDFWRSELIHLLESKPASAIKTKSGQLRLRNNLCSAGWMACRYFLSK
jgi:hypothetical protein